MAPAGHLSFLFRLIQSRRRGIPPSNVLINLITFREERTCGMNVVLLREFSRGETRS